MFPGFQRASQPLFCVIPCEYQPCEIYTAVRFTRLELLFHLLQERKLTLRNPLERFQVSGRVKIGLIPCLSRSTGKRKKKKNLAQHGGQAICLLNSLIDLIKLLIFEKLPKGRNCLLFISELQDISWDKMITYYIFIKWLFHLENNQEWEYSSPWELMHFSVWVSCLLRSYFQVPLYWKINFSLILFQSSIITHWYMIILLKSAFLKSRRCVWVQKTVLLREWLTAELGQPIKR